MIVDAGNNKHHKPLVYVNYSFIHYLLNRA